jgi:hypothetical protein
MGARTGIWRGSPPTLRVAAPGSATPGIRAGKSARSGRRDAAARVVAATPSTTPADAPTAAAAAPAGARAPIPLAATATRAAKGTRTTTAIASARRARAGTRRSAGAVDGMEAGARRGGVDSGRDSRQQLDVAGRGERLVRRVRRQAAGCRGGDGILASPAGFCPTAGPFAGYVSARRAPSRASLRTAGRRRSWAAAGAAHVGHRTWRHPAAPGAGAPATGVTPAAQAATPQRRRRRDHRWAVGRRTAGQASGHPHRWRPSSPARGMR